jgi:hypothetical protein
VGDYAKKRAQVGRLRDLLRALAELGDGLPSREDLAKADASLSELAGYIQSVRDRLQHVPTVEEVGSIVTAASALQGILARAESSPVLSMALGVEPSRPAARPKPSREVSTISIDEVTRRFGDLTIDQLRDTLGDERTLPLSELQTIARAVGARSGSRLGRDSLVLNVVTKIANLRGYRSLGPS